MRILLLLLLIAAPAQAGERVDLLKLTNSGYLQAYNARDVELEATFAGPLQEPGLPVPTALRENHVTGALFPTNWSTHPMRGTGLVAPLPIFVKKADSDWLFTMKPGSQIVVRGRFQVVTGVGPGGGTVPKAHPLLEVYAVLDVDQLRTMEADEATEPRPRFSEDRAAIVRRRARLEALKGTLSRATPSDLNAEERIRRKELLLTLRDQLDAAGVTDPILRARKVAAALDEHAFPPVQAGEEP